MARGGGRRCPRRPGDGRGGDPGPDRPAGGGRQGGPEGRVGRRAELPAQGARGDRRRGHRARRGAGRAAPDRAHPGAPAAPGAGVPLHARAGAGGHLRQHPAPAPPRAAPARGRVHRAALPRAPRRVLRAPRPSLRAGRGLAQGPRVPPQGGGRGRPHRRRRRGARLLPKGPRDPRPGVRRPLGARRARRARARDGRGVLPPRPARGGEGAPVPRPRPARRELSAVPAGGAAGRSLGSSPARCSGGRSPLAAGTARPVPRTEELYGVYRALCWIDYLDRSSALRPRLPAPAEPLGATGHHPRVANGSAAVGLMFAHVPLERAARGYRERSLALAGELGDPLVMGDVLLLRGAGRARARALGRRARRLRRGGAPVLGGRGAAGVGHAARP